MSSFWFYCAVILVVYLYYRFVTGNAKNASSLPLPPGPRGVPILGNALQLPVGQEWITYHRWGKEYGPIMHVNALGQPLIILNSHKIAIELLEKRGAIHSDRPYLTMGGELVGWDQSLVLTHVGERFKEMRKQMHRVVGGKNTKQFWNLEEKETKKFLLRLLKQPTEFRELIRVTAGAIILIISHGYTVDPTPHKDPFVQLADKATEQFSESTEPGRWIVDLVPIMKHIPTWFPGASFQRTALQMRATLDKMTNMPFDLVKSQMKDGTAPPSFTKLLLEEKEGKLSEYQEETIKWSAASLYSGGADTTVSAIATFFLAMTLNPDVMRKAQEELDRVVGDERLPSFEDREKLKYVDAMVKEVLRWGPVGPLAVPHRSTSEDYYEGYRLPKGSLIFANIWGITRDERMYPEPERFNPERFLTTTADSEKGPIDPRQISFGYGRRICPGQNLADLSLFISIAMTLHVFDITAVEGHPAKYEYTNGTISHPKDFKCHITPRKGKEKVFEGIKEEMAREGGEWAFLENEEMKKAFEAATLTAEV